MADISEKTLEVLTDLATLLKEQKEGELHTKTPANFMTAQPLHGSGGLWAVAGLERDIITALT